MPNGKTTTTLPQLNQAAKKAVAFIKASENYQVCILDDISAQDQHAKNSKKALDPAIRKALEDKGDANQIEKERIGKQYNVVAAAYKVAHLNRFALRSVSQAASGGNIKSELKYEARFLRTNVSMPVRFVRMAFSNGAEGR